MSPNKYRLVFAKRGVLRFVSHLDLLRIFELALRRSGLPVRFTSGFNPRVKLSTEAALPVGVESECETLDVYLTEPVEPEVIRKRLGECLPEGMELKDVRGNADALERIGRESYCVTLRDGTDVPEQAAIDALMSRSEIPFLRRRKEGKDRPLDLRPHLLDIRTEGGKVYMDLLVRDSVRIRPEEVLSALSEAANRPLVALRIRKLAAGP
jgi:radical SAM-linked protein